MFTKRFLFLRSLKLVLAFLVLAGSAQAEIEDLTEEVWSVCGWDGISSWDDTRLIFTNQIDGEDGAELVGYFDWRNDLGSTGREHFQGTLTPSRDLALQGISLQDGRNVMNSLYEGRGYLPMTPQSLMGALAFGRQFATALHIFSSPSRPSDRIVGLI